jgi:hypothetical protein
MGFAAALLLFEATSGHPRDKRSQDAQTRDQLAYQEQQRRMRAWGISAAIVAVIAAYVAAFSG